MSRSGKGQAVTTTIAPGPSGGWPFRRVLIANRGEIALRILRTVRALGLEAVVVYHAADATTPAVQAADRAIEITGSTPVAAYLDGAQIVAAARDSGAGAADLACGNANLLDAAPLAGAIKKADMGRNTASASARTRPMAPIHWQPDRTPQAPPWPVPSLFTAIGLMGTWMHFLPDYYGGF